MPRKVAFASLLAPLVAFAASPSFDCSQAKAGIETVICGDDDLAALDRKLADVYAAALAAMSEEDATAERSAQAAWLRERDACGKAVDPKACAERVYEPRVTALQVKGGAVQVPAPTFYDCGKVGTVTVYFYNDTQRPAAVVNVGVHVQELTLVQPSGSGAQYAGKRLTFWTKGDSAILIRPGKPDATCTLLPGKPAAE